MKTMGLTKILLLLLMIYLHIVDDYRHQGILAQMKQKSYWEENAPDKMYRYDYIAALFMHSFSWSFMIMIVPTLYSLYYNTVSDNRDITVLIILLGFVLNLACHMITDHAKANKKCINLIVDQATHIVWIFATWAVFIS